MLWNVIYDFFVSYIFGGYDSSGVLHEATLGYLYNRGQQTYISQHTGIIGFDLPLLGTNYTWQIPFGNYLSITATIISLVVILVLCCKLIKQIYNICAHVIG